VRRFGNTSCSSKCDDNPFKTGISNPSTSIFINEMFFNWKDLNEKFVINKIKNSLKIINNRAFQ